MQFTASFHPQNITNPSKTLYLKKISLSSQSNSPYKKELHSIFNDPSSYLKLPAELNLPFVVGNYAVLAMTLMIELFLTQ